MSSLPWRRTHPLGSKGKIHVTNSRTAAHKKAGWWNATLLLWDFSRSNKHEETHKNHPDPRIPTLIPCILTPIPRIPTLIPHIPNTPTPIPHIPTLILHIPTLIPHVPTLIPYVPTLIPRVPTLISGVPTLIPRVPIISLILFSNSPFWFL